MISQFIHFHAIDTRFGCLRLDFCILSEIARDIITLSAMFGLGISLAFISGLESICINPAPLDFLGILHISERKACMCLISLEKLMSSSGS